MDVLAYIDAGTGSMLLQASMTAIVACALFFRQIKGFFKKLFSKNEASKSCDMKK
ncbi:MAG: hypothetical protein IKP58_15825 [Victivallales bacterium]|nr:hypothetical protein [Victivallales bacterium]